MILLDGKETAAEIRAEIREEVDALEGKFGRKPGLAVVLVGEDPASQVYVRSKGKQTVEVGMNLAPMAEREEPRFVWNLAIGEI